MESPSGGALECEIDCEVSPEVECLRRGHAREPSLKHGPLCAPDIGSARLPHAAHDQGKNQIHPMVIRVVSRRRRWDRVADVPLFPLVARREAHFKRPPHPAAVPVAAQKGPQSQLLER